MTNLNGLNVAILATDGFEQSELTEPKRALDEAGAFTVVVSLKEGQIRGWKHADWGDAIRVDRTLDQVRASDFDALVLPGGVMNPDKLRDDADAVAFVKRFAQQNKPIAAICHGPMTMIDADIVRGVTMTSYSSIHRDLMNAGAKWVDAEVVTDRNIVTSRTPKDLPAFCRAMIQLFGDFLATSKKNGRHAHA